MVGGMDRSVVQAARMSDDRALVQVAQAKSEGSLLGLSRLHFLHTLFQGSHSSVKALALLLSICLFCRAFVSFILDHLHVLYIIIYIISCIILENM